jgi:hypothetical protein
MNKKNIVPFTDAEERLLHKLSESRDKTAVRFPLFFGLAASFGLVSTYYGFEKLIDKVDLFASHPWLILVVGVVVLILTGTAYKKLN